MINKDLISTVYKLYFPNGVHIGNNKLNTSEIEINADTLFSALCHEAQKHDNNGAKKLYDLALEGKFKISDALPFVKDELFLPKPILRLNSDKEDSSEKKLFKRISNIPLSYWNEYISGKSNPQELISSLEGIISSKLYTKIRHDNLGEHNIYQVGVTYFNDESGLYFILQCEEKEKNYFSDLIYSLQFSGIGGKRSSGFGRFYSYDNDISEGLKKLLEKKSEKYMSISISYPTQEELINTTENSIGYNLVRRGGFIYSKNSNGTENESIRKKDVFMFKSGSVFKEKFKGEILNLGVNYQHPIYKYGIGMFVGVDWYERKKL